MGTSKPTKKTASRKPALQVEPAPGKKLLITDVVLRDGHQSLLATRMRTEDMLPIAQKLDAVGYWSLEMWGGATFDTCLRFLKEDPWERLRALRAAMPNTRLQMLLRGQNIVGYRHYADDVLERFIERAATNGIEVPDLRRPQRPAEHGAGDARGQNVRQARRGLDLLHR